MYDTPRRMANSRSIRFVITCASTVSLARSGGGPATAASRTFARDDAGFARADAPEEEVRTGFLEVLSRQLEPARRADLEEARQHYINDPTDENWQRFEKLKLDGPGLHGSERDSGRYPG